MTLFHVKPPQLAFIAGKIVCSGSATGVIGGTMTAGTFDNESSALIEWQPPFVSAPQILASINSGLNATITSPVVRFSGVTACGAYMTMGETGLSGATIGILLLGEAKL